MAKSSTKKKTLGPDRSMSGTAQFAALARALDALDAVLEIAVDKQARLLGPATLLDPWRGMHLDQNDIKRLLSTTPNAALLSVESISVPDVLASAFKAFPRASRLAEEFKLPNTDLAALLIALAPDVDLRYERIYAYLQDDIARKRPTLDLIANLLARDVGERLAICGRFAAATPLEHFGLLVSEGSIETSPLARMWRLDGLWRSWLIGNESVIAHLDGAKLITPAMRDIDELALGEATKTLIRQAIEAKTDRRMPLRILMYGPHGSGKLSLAHAVARAAQQKLLFVDLRDCASHREMQALLQRAQRTALLSNAVLYLHGIARLEQRDGQMLRVLIETLANSTCGFLMALSTVLPPLHAGALPWIRIELGYPSVEARRGLWQRALAARDREIECGGIERIAARFSLSAAQIDQAVAEADALAICSKTTRVAYEELAAAVRVQCGSDLARIAQKIVPKADFEALVVPSEVQLQLREICARVTTRDAVGREWANGCVHSRAVGVTALFVGPSGTGKTLSAEALARELGLDLYGIDLAGIVSKYIGDTEKNLDRVFAAAEHANAVLFFDEADALFGKRSEVKDAHDRYANIEVAYLLKKMENFDGLAILATNLKQNLDEAFARRLTFTVNFPFPEEAERCKLWERLWPPRTPRSPDVDLAWFAREFRLSGGNIRNAVLAAAHLAAAEGKIASREHVLHATRREYQKLGKNLVYPLANKRLTG